MSNILNVGKYLQPTVKIVELSTSDVITTSNAMEVDYLGQNGWQQGGDFDSPLR